MATTTFSAAPDNSTDALYRDWASKLSDAIQAVGLVKTTDTGMPNWTTVAKPTSNSYVYECFRFNDSLQATVPIFLRIGYGGGSGGGAPSLSIAVGKGTNGANALTTPIGTVSMGTCTATTVASTWYVSSGDGSQLFITSPLNQLATVCISIFFERSRNPSGAPTGAGGFFGCRDGTAGSDPSCKSFGYPNPALSPFVPTPAIPGGNSYPSLAIGGVAPMMATLCTDGYGAFWQPRVLLGHLKDDCTVAVPVTVPGFGTYLPLGSNMSTTGSNNRVAVAWY